MNRKDRITVSFALSMALLTVAAAEGASASRAWPNGYAYQATFTVAAGQVPSALTNFPALISGTFGDFATTANGGRISNTCTQTVGNNAMAAPCDLIFTSDAGGAVLLNWEFESWTPATGAVNVWVNVPTLSNGTVIYAWYGQPSVTTLQTTPSATWSNSFMAVYHLSEDPAGAAPQMNDSTANGNNATMNGPVLASQQQPGEIDGSVNFEGNTWASLANPANFSFERTDSFSLSGWFNIPTNSLGTLLSKFENGNAGWALAQDPGATSPVFSFGLFGEGQSTLLFAETPAVSLGAWHYVVATYSGTGSVTGMNIYVDGVNQPLTILYNNLATSILNDTTPAINGRGGPTQMSADSMDELRVSTKGVALSPAWVTASYNNQSHPGAFFTALAGLTPGGSLAASSSSLMFPSQAVGTSSAAQAFVIANNGTGAAAIGGISITGTDPGDFAQTNNCPLNPATLAVNGSCTVNVTFTPLAANLRSAAIAITGNSFLSVGLSGTGTQLPSTVTLSPSSFAFPNQTVNVAVASAAGDEPAGMQWTLTYSPAAIVSISATAGDSANAADKSLTCTASSGSFTCLLAGMNTTVMQNGVVAVVSLTIASGVTSTALNVTNTLGTDPGGNTLILNGGGGVQIPASPLLPVLSALSCVPASLITGGSSTCTALLSAPAPSGGMSLTLSSNLGALTVPASVTVAAGNTTVTFTATAGLIASAQTAIVTATLNGSIQTAPISLLASCTYAITFGGEAFPAAGGAGSVGVVAAGGCFWTASSSLSWVIIASGASGTGIGTVSYQVAANSGGAQTGSLTIAGLPFEVEQASATATGMAAAGSMSQIASGGTWNTTITLVNTGTTPAEVVLNFFDDNGNPLTLPVTFPQTGAITAAAPLLSATLDQTIGAGAELVIQTAGTASQATVEGWAQLLSDGTVGGSAIFADTTAMGTQEAVVPLETRNPAAFVLPFNYTGGYATGVALANLSGQPVTVPVVLRGPTGSSLGTASIGLAAHAHTSFMLASNYPAVTGIFGAMELDTPPNGQIGALGIRAAPDGAITTVPVLAEGAVSNGSMAQVAAGGTWNTTITLVNTSTTAAQVSLNFYGDNGSAVELPVTFPVGSTTAAQTVSTIDQSVGAEAQLVIETAGAADQATSQGWAQLTVTGGNVGGSAVFADTTAAGIQEAVVPVENQNASAYVLPFDYTGGHTTGVAVANLTNQAVSIPVVLRDSTGASLGTAASIILGPNAHTSFLLSTSYPAVTGLLGTLELDMPSGGQISALGIRAAASGAITTVPVLAK